VHRTAGTLRVFRSCSELGQFPVSKLFSPQPPVTHTVRRLQQSSEEDEMKLTARIDNDIKSLERYFHRLFDVLREAIVENASVPMEPQDVDAVESQAVYHRFDQFIKPDMLINIYNLLDFWLKEICSYHKRKNNLKLEYKDIKGNNELHTYKKYLIEYVGLDLTSAEDSYNRLDELRKLRNIFIHSGGHIPENKEQEFSKIDGITLYGSLVVVEEKYIWDALEYAKSYLFTTTNA
jgi:hypothetical protein